LTVDRGIPSVNLVTNPSIESATISMYTASGSAISQSSSQAATGSNSLLVNPANSAAGEGFYWTSGSVVGQVNPNASYLVASCEVRGASASGDAEIVIQNSSGTDIATGTSVSLSTGFQQISAKYRLPDQGDATYRVMVRTKTQHNINFYVDKIHVEQRIGDSNIPDYVDGAQGLNYEWTGTANASTSIRRAGLSVIRGIKVVNESSTAADIVYVGLDCDASATTGIPVLGGQSFETNWPIDFREKVTVIAAQNTPAAHGVIWGIHQG
jgi:hypothetical protein|tara:strand:+ start:692 stop:1495 length:804 start_codon:yes stop_codon:yes gene_type:complete